MTSPVPPSYTPTPRGRHLSGIEEEDKLSQKDREPSSSSATRDNLKKSESVDRNKSEAKPVRAPLNRRKSVDVEEMMRVRSRDNLAPVSQSRPESPPITSPRRDSSKYSPRIERKKIINKLKKLAVEEPATTTDGGGEKPQPQQPSLSSSLLSQLETGDGELESSLDLYRRDSSESAIQEGLPETEEPIHIHSPLDAILQAMEAEK